MASGSTQADQAPVQQASESALQELAVMTDSEIILKAIAIIECNVIVEGCKTPDYEDFRDPDPAPEVIGTRDINWSGRCYVCAATQVVHWLRDYLEIVSFEP